MIKKIIGYVAALMMAAAACTGFTVAGQGYEMYQAAVAETSLESMVDSIRSKEGYTCLLYTSIGLLFYTVRKAPELLPARRHMKWNREEAAGISRLSMITSVQQSIMNFGILMVQGRVNSFGPAVMAAFAAAVKIDSFAYMPVQDFGNAFSTFIAQNYGAGKESRIRQGILSAVRTSMLFGAAVSVVIWIFAEPLMRIFVNGQEREILAIGVEYLRIEGAFYCLIGLLF